MNSQSFNTSNLAVYSDLAPVNSAYFGAKPVLAGKLFSPGVNTTVSSLPQCSKTLFPSVTSGGRGNCLRLVQSANALNSIFASLQEFRVNEYLTLVSAEQPKNAILSMSSTLPGMVTVVSETQFAKQLLGMVLSEDGSVTDDSFGQSLNMLLPSSVTESLSVTLPNAVPAKQRSPNLVTPGHEPLDSFVQPSNAYAGSSVTPAGILIDCSAVQYSNALL